MHKHMKAEDGKYHINGKVYFPLEGSRAQVYHETAYKTSGGLKKKDLLMTKRGHIVSKKKHETAKKEKRLEKYGYFAEKGKFGAVRRSPRKSSKRSSPRKSSKRSSPRKAHTVGGKSRRH